MAFLNETFSVDTLPQSQGGNFDPLPAGFYNVAIAGAELKATRDQTGQYIAVRYDVTGPTHQGRVVFANINIRNQNPKAEEIGRAQLGELMRAIGLTTVQDTDQLIGGQLQIKVAVRPAQNGYEASNDVKGFKALGGAPAQMMQQSAPMQQPQQQYQQPQQNYQQPMQQPTAPMASSVPPWAQQR